MNAAQAQNNADFTNNQYVDQGLPVPSSNPDNTNAYLSVLNSTGSGLVYSTYYGGDGDDFGGDNTNTPTNLAITGDAATGIALSSTTAYITGYTNSANLSVPATALQSTVDANSDDGSSFVAAFDTTGSGAGSLLYSTYIGGNNDTTIATAIALDTTGNVYVTGDSNNNIDFGQHGAVGQTFNSTSVGAAAFVMSLNPTLTAYNYNELLSGSGSDQGESIAVDSSGNAYVAGATTSTNFPVTPGALMTSNPDTATGSYTLGVPPTAGFVTKIAAGGSSILYSTYLGGDALPGYPLINNFQLDDATYAYGFIPDTVFGANLDYGDSAFGIALDASGDAYVTGSTLSQNFPVTDGSVYQASVASYGFLSVLNPAGSALIYSTLSGATAANSSGTYYASGTALLKVTVDTSDNIYVTGNTGDGNFGTTAGAFQTTFTGNEFEAVAAKYSPVVVPPTPPTPPVIPPTTGEASLYPDDRFEANETEDAATNFGVLQEGQANSQEQDSLTVNIHDNGLPDYDWYTWSAATSGTFTTSIDVTQTGTSTSQLELHVFTVNSSNTLVEEGTQSAAVNGTVSVSVQLTAGESIYVEVKGVEEYPGYRDQGVYNITAAMS